ncbi:hypothetical protein GUA87_04760 [Sneathiella sp. P13V-1]|uniref:hypothetical protein n=1 Tax=Sneathiella sp. P13V-1 TaxID=2697366 RepID=UPI00187B1CF3|nr:hypothetical protein [Sneathiella sp. P13V-1]MBE7636144.1 hypothetical protein [Sneathiella sp. P13V-1]
MLSLFFVSGAYATELVKMPVSNKPGCEIYHWHDHKSREKVNWDGKCVNGLAHGVGTATFWHPRSDHPFLEKHSYKGKFVKGFMDGHSYQVTIDKRGDQIVEMAKYKDRKLHGPFKTTFPNGVILERTYKNGKPEKISVKTLANGDIYRGVYDELGFQGDVRIKFNDPVFNTEAEILFQDNKPAKTGKLTLNDGRVIFGPVKGHQVTGEGSIIYSSGRVYHGHIVKNQPHGKGLFESALIEITGTFSGSENDGKGRILFKKSKSRYEGEFRSGKPHGKGAYMMPSGLFLKGSFVDGKIHGEGQVITKRWGKLAGTFESGAPVGTFKLKAGREGYCSIKLNEDFTPYGDGIWLSDQQHQKGVCNYQSGSGFVFRY